MDPRVFWYRVMMFTLGVILALCIIPFLNLYFYWVDTFIHYLWDNHGAFHK